MLGDDDVCLPGRLRRQVAIFDRHPDTGVVHGDATVIDSAGSGDRPLEQRRVPPGGRWCSRSSARHNHLVDPTRMVHRRVYDAVGGYDDRVPARQRLRLLAARRADVPLSPLRRRPARGGPPPRREHLRRDLGAVARGRRRGARARGRARALSAARARAGARLGRARPRRRRAPGAATARRRARAPRGCRCQGWRPSCAAAPRRCRAADAGGAVRGLGSRPGSGSADGSAKRLLMTSFGFNDSGGGTTVPRLAAKELARRGWDVTVFHAAVAPTPAGCPYELRESEQDGVRLIGVHNRPHGLFDAGTPIASSTTRRSRAAFVAHARPRPARRRPLPQPPQPRRVADRPGRRAGSARVLLDPQLLADLPARLPADGRGQDLRRPGRRGGGCAPASASHDADGHRRAARARFAPVPSAD